MRPPKQSRSQRTLASIADAGLEILENEGLQALSVAAVVKRAGVSVGSFYARFSGKEEFLTYLEGVRRTRALEAWEGILRDPSWEGLSLPEAVERVVKRMWELDRGKGSVGRGAPPPAADRESSRAESGPILAFLSRWAAEIPHPNPHMPLEVGYAMVKGAIREMGLRGSEELGPQAGGDVLVRELARAWFAYLTAEPPSPKAAPAAGEGGASPSPAQETHVFRRTADGAPVRRAPGTSEEGLDYFDPWS